ncbi:MAG TPA: CpaD family pilus assembly lipoprotein [Aliidongia sp.]|nr:CpaD family pilus assembly lipoprotein [Aliidongia sp.]
MKRIIPAILPLLLITGLGACSNSDEIPTSQLAPVKQAQVVKREQQFVVPAGRGTPELSATYRGGFDRFLAEAGGGKPQMLHLTLFGGAPQVAAALRQAAIADGVDPAKIEIRPTAVAPAASTGAAGVQTTVVATTYGVQMPTCAGGPTDALSRDQNPAWSDFGCSVNSTLAAMVADPHDLIRGEAGGETDSAIAGAAIDRLMQDKVKKLDNGQSFTPLGGSGGGSGQ